jgi:hypothetical protein
MSCCGQKRNALKQSSPAAPITAARGAASRQRPPAASAPGQRTQSGSSAAMFAYLTRNARSRRH